VDLFQVEVEHDLNALAPFRHRLDGWLRSHGLADSQRASVVLASHEAVANAIEHSASPTPVLIKAEANDEAIVVEIIDKGNWRPARVEPDDERGRGLAMIKALVSHVHISSLGGGTTIRLIQHI
jgi:anti-sigma regulatory factor (Ser/Thr protein kinase)